jgi:exosortase
MRNDSAYHVADGRRASLIAAAMCAAAFILLLQFYGNSTLGYIKSASLFQWWVSQWLDPRAESDHGWLILGISLWLFWRNLRRPGQSLEQGAGGREQEESRSVPATPNSKLQTPNFAAFAAMLAGLLLHAVGFAAQQARVSIIGLLIFAWGTLRLAGGRRWGDAAIFPLGFMLFAIPINVLDSIGFWLRMWVIEASTVLAHSAGIEVVRSGTQLLAPDGRYNYDVAAACSGVRSLTALAALSLLVGYLSFKSWLRRVFVLLLCFPLVYLGNVARIASIIFAAQIGGPKWGDAAHDVMGYGIFVIVLGGVMGATTLMQKWLPEKVSPERASEPLGNEPQSLAAQPPAVESPRSPDAGRSAFAGLWAGAGGVVALTIGAAFFLHHLATSPERGSAGVALSPDGINPIELPAFVGTEWIGKRTPVTAVEREILPADTGFSRKVYVPLADARREVLFSIVLSGRDRTSIHRPELCLVGQGWTIVGASREGFELRPKPGAAGTFAATVLELQREIPTAKGTVVEPFVAAYWFVDSDRIVATHWQRILRDAWNRVTRARADRWAYVLMQTDARDGRAAALARMQAVLDGTVPSFLRLGAER